MNETVFETDESVVPLRRSRRYGGLRTGPLRIVPRHRISLLPLAMVAVLAAAGSATALITTQPPVRGADEVPAAAVAAGSAVDPEASADRMSAAIDSDVGTPIPADADPSQDGVPIPHPARPAQEAASAFGPASLPTLAIDETALGIARADEDPLAAPVTPRVDPAPRPTAAFHHNRPRKRARPTE